MYSKIALILTALLFVQTQANAAVTLVDKDDWKVLMSGFVEMDAFQDSTRSYIEVVGNAPVAKAGTMDNSYGRTQFSVRNSRLAFTVLPPVQDDWKTKGYYEFDLLGYEPAVGSAAYNGSESNLYTNPTVRVRHAYLSGETNGWQVLAGQTWSLFGWQTKYMLTNVSVAPVPGYIYQRTPQIYGSKTLGLNDSTTLYLAVSAERPSQRDGNMPNLTAGLRLAYSGWSSGFSSYVGETNIAPMSVAITATSRQFITGDTSTSPTATTKTQGQAYAVDALIPIVPSTDGKDGGNTLTLSGEFTAGKGYADGLAGWSGNLPVSPGAAGNAAATNLDAGQGGFDSTTGTFSLVQLQAWSAQLQYQFASNLHLFADIGHGQTQATQLGNLSPNTGKSLYDGTSVNFVNVFHDLTKQIRVAAEYDMFQTHYFADGSTANDNRYQISGYFRF